MQTAKGEFVYLTHMQKRSIRVVVGGEVQPGDSDNTSEPHLHIHARNVANFFGPNAMGLPLEFCNLDVNGTPVA